MYPGREAPDFGTFVAQLERELIAQGHAVARAVIDHREGSAVKYARLGSDAVRAALRFGPDVVYAHYLVPTGTLAALAALVGRVPLVVTAHGRDVRNIGEIPGVRQATRVACGRAAAVIVVSEYLRQQLLLKLPELDGKLEVVDCGVDLARFRGRDALAARELVGWQGDGPHYLFVGSLDARKNPLRLLEAFERLEAGELAMIGDGELRSQLEGHPRVRMVGRIPHARVADWIGACDVLVQPSLVEPFGQALLEAMASERSVLATKSGGPPEFVTPEAGVLVDPRNVDEIEAGLRAAARLPAPNSGARAAAAQHDVRRQAGRIAAILEDTTR